MYKVRLNVNIFIVQFHSIAFTDLILTSLNFKYDRFTYVDFDIIIQR